MVKYNSINKNLFVQNREKLNLELKQNSIVILSSNKLMYRNGNQEYVFRQNSDFFYLSGIDQEESVVILCQNHENEKYREILFVAETNEKIKIWNGPKYTKNEAAEISGINNVYCLSELESILEILIKDVENMYYNDFPGFEKSNSIVDNLLKANTKCKIERLSPILKTLRIKKEPEEIELLQQACDITEKAFSRVLTAVKPNIGEYEIEAEIAYEFIRNRANGSAYPSIVASGKNACILHYIDNNSICKDGDLLLMDFGAEYANYAADCSRTIPVSGKFTSRQKECYNAVLQVMNNAIKMMVPGNTIGKIHFETCKMLQAEHVNLGLYTEEDIKNQDSENPLWKKYYPHGTSHFIGLDVHDVGDRDTILEEGMVLSCEPGLYIPDEDLGIRIEDDIVVGNPPRNLLQNVPKEVVDIENLMNAENN